ncbi:MAG: DUF167 domain-containing protein [bacterium]|nr:DUF167 domain-containing protein [bacterium]
MNIRTIRVHVQPNAKRGSVEHVSGNEYRAWVDAPPADGKANERLIALLAEHLGCKRWQLSIMRGALGREKIVRIENHRPA